MNLKTGYYTATGEPVPLEQAQRTMFRTSELVNRYNQKAYVPINKNFVNYLITNEVIRPNGYYVTINGNKINTYSLSNLFLKINWYENNTPIMKDGKHVMDYPWREEYKKLLGLQNKQPSKKEQQNKKSEIARQQRSWYDSTENRA